jgi:alkyl sulfatase BDS1-like metallo-beta-lactamase superfamily hydrolase
MRAGDPRAPKDATEATRAAHAAAAAALPWHDRADFERATRGRIAGPSSQQVLGPGGLPAWDLDAYAFLQGEPPATVHPSLWRQAQLNATAGLFEVVPGVYQVRGLDLSNVTFVAGDTGWVVVDPLTTAVTARAALDLVTEHLGERPVRAVIYTHSHVDHFGGVRGVVDEEEVAAGRVPIVAPAGFLEAAISENVVAGTVMSRRATYMYGMLLPRGPRGHVDAGLGKSTPLARAGLLAPTDEVHATGEERVLDGVRLELQLTPGAEAPAEMNFLFPDLRLLCMAENCTATFHNVYTPRGAQVRDALAWSKYVQEAIERFGDRADVVCASHHWPRFGREDALHFLGVQRDLYRYVHDQTMRLANHGLTMDEIAEALTLPEELAREWSARGYYGTLNHNAKAVYQRYLGWFDGNPAHLHPLPPVEAARRYVEWMGGSAEVLRRARAAFDAGDLRWVAQVVDHVVFAEPGNEEARLLQADALEQLGYQAESGPWRSFYLTGAQELRHGVPRSLPALGTANPEIVAAMTTEMLLDYLAVRLDGPRAAGRRIVCDLEVVDGGDVDAEPQRWTVVLERGALHAVAGRHAGPAEGGRADVTLALARPALAALVTGEASPADLAAQGHLVLEGDASALDDLLELCDRFDFWFDIVTP